MFWRKSKNEGSHDLRGLWTVDRSDAATVDELGDVTLEFHSDGMLTYTITSPDKHQIILLTYRIEGREIITDQPSHPDEQRSEFEVIGKRLMVVFGGERSHFVRA